MASVLPDVTQTIKDGGLGIVPVAANNVVACVGVCSGGTANTVATFSDITTMKNALGTGPLVEAAAHIMAVSGQQVVTCKVTSSAPTTPLGAVTNGGTGSSVLSVSGTPVDSYAAQVKVVTGSTGPTTGIGTFQYSLDGGSTWSIVTSLPVAGTFTVPNTGILLTFATGTLVAGDVYSFAATGPIFTTANMNTALDTLLADTSSYFLVHVVGQPADSTAGAALSAALESKLIGAETTLFRYVRGLINAEDDTDANLKTNYAAVSNTRTMIAAGYARIVSQLSGAQMKRPAAFTIAARAASVSPVQDLGAVADGGLKGVTALLRDEQKTPGLDAARFATLRTIVGLPGFYVTNPRIMSAPTSDYQFLQYGRLMDIASTLNRFALLFFLNAQIRVKNVTGPQAGTIVEADAQQIEQRVDSIVRTGTTQPGYATDIIVVLDRTINVLSTQRLSTKLRVLPPGYAKYIDTEISLFNPALIPATPS